METIRRIDKVPAPTKKAVTKALESMIEKFGLSETRLTVVNYFSKYRETQQRKKKIAELEKEIESLNKKK